jgi:hypothetical protein
MNTELPTIPDNPTHVSLNIIEYKRLVERDKMLSRLEAVGVDNWEGYHYSFENEDEEED